MESREDDDADDDGNDDEDDADDDDDDAEICDGADTIGSSWSTYASNVDASIESECAGTGALRVGGGKNEADDDEFDAILLDSMCVASDGLNAPLLNRRFNNSSIVIENNNALIYGTTCSCPTDAAMSRKYKPT